MKNFKKLIKEAHLGNPLDEIRTIPVSGTKAGVTYSLDSDRKLVLKKDVEGARIGDYVDITLPKGTVIYNLPGGVFAAHESLKRFATDFNPYYEKPTYSGISVIRSRDTLAAIEDAANLNETAGTFGDGVSDEIKAKYNEAAMDEYGKPFAELDIFQKQELMKAIVKYTRPEFKTDFQQRRQGDLEDEYDGITDYQRRRMDEELLKEFTVPGGNYRDSYANNLPEEELRSPDEYELFMEMFPRGEASRILMDPNRKKLFDQHLEWTKDTQYNNVFQHMQYHDVEYEGEPYRIHQTQYYNTNYKDFRNPSYTELMISKDGKRMGTYLVDTKEYIKDLKDLEVKDRVMEGTCGYSEDGDIDPENTDKLKPAGGKTSDEKLADMEKELERLLKGVGYKSSIYGNFINEIESGDVVVYKDKDHIVQGIKNFDQDTMVSIRPNTLHWTGAKYEAFWVKPEDLKKSVNESYMGNKGDEVMITNTKKPDGDIPGNWVLEKPDGSAQIDMFFDSKEAAKKYAKDKELKLVPGFKEDIAEIDMNDPVLVKTRASQMKRDKIEADEKAKKSYLDTKYGPTFMDKLEAEIDLKNELQNLEKEREDVLMRIEDIGVETEQTAEPEGGKIADKLGRRLMAAEKELRAIDNKIIDVKDELGHFRMYESVNEDLQLDVDLYSKGNPGIFSRADERVQVTIPGKFGDNEGDTALQKALADLGKEYISYKVKDVKELNEEGDGGAEPNDKELDIKSSSDAALDNAVKDMGYNESKGFDFKKMVKEALTPKNLK